MRQIQLTEWTFEGKQKAFQQVWATDDTVMSKRRLYPNLVCLNIFRRRGAPQKARRWLTARKSSRFRGATKYSENILQTQRGWYRGFFTRKFVPDRFLSVEGFFIFNIIQSEDKIYVPEYSRFLLRRSAQRKPYHWQLSRRYQKFFRIFREI